MKKARGVKTGTKKSQAYKNTKAYSIRYHDDKKKLQDTAVLDRVCTRCYEQLQWKLQYGKYKPLKQAKKCQSCKNKTILKPYRVLCNKCGDKMHCCTKCGKNKDYSLDSYKHAPNAVVHKRVQLMQANMKLMQERSVRRVKRLLWEDKIRFREGKFYYKANMKEVENIKYKKKYWDDLGIEDPNNPYSDEEDEDFEIDTQEKQNDSQQKEGSNENKLAERFNPQIENGKVENQIEERSGIKINF